MNLRLHIWRQRGPKETGAMQIYGVKDVSPDMSFLEMLDVLNEDLVNKGEEPIVFDHDCREGICGACSMVINGVPHGPKKKVTTCQLHMRSFEGESDIYIEPWRANAFPIIKDLMVDRSAFDRIIQAGGYISVRTGSAPDANSIPIDKHNSDEAFAAAACIGCGACVAACQNASAMLFVGAKTSQLALLPQGDPERTKRVVAMVHQMDGEGFGNCTNQKECQAACPKDISVKHISRMNREYARAQILSD